MQIEMTWTEQITYCSTLTLDANDLAAIREDEGLGPDEPIKARHVRRYFRQDVDVWIDRVDPAADFQSVDERDVEDVGIVENATAGAG